MKTITSKDNNLIKQRTLLKTTRGRKNEGMFLVEGLRLCLDAINSSFTFVDAFFTEQFLKSHEEDADRIMTCSENIIIVSPEIMQKLCDTENPQGIICVCKKPNLSFDIKREGKYILLENVADPSNLGAISRTAEAFGLDGLLITGGCDVFNMKALRASMGALLRLPTAEYSSIEDVMITLKDKNITTYAAVVKDAEKEIREVDFKKGCAAVIGNEANGLSQTAKNLADVLVTIGMDGHAESLNAHAASAVFIWEMVR